jgi:type IV secretory pathway VirD2 relaxase
MRPSGAEIAHACRTARGAPEVVVKVSGGARSVRGVAAHIDYISRDGEGEIETDDGRVLHEKGVGQTLLQDWDLDLDTVRRHTQRAIVAGRRPLKLVHNIVFSMPRTTPPDKLHKAVRRFASEKFGLQHRYAMALHTDQGHPHVHVVVKAVSEEGVRMNIRKETLREWRQDFAQYLRELGIEANATERAVRGVTKPRKTDGIHRAALRGDSTHYRQRALTVARELGQGGVRPEAGKAKLIHTREVVRRGWLGLADTMESRGQREDAHSIRSFVDRMPPARTEKEWIADRLISHDRGRRREEVPSLTR